MSLILVFNKTWPWAHTESELDVFGVHGKLVKKKKKNSMSKGGPGMNEVSFRARPHRNAHNTLGVDT
jgi:hypothetical protein